MRLGTKGAFESDQSALASTVSSDVRRDAPRMATISVRDHLPRGCMCLTNADDTFSTKHDVESTNNNQQDWMVSQAIRPRREAVPHLADRVCFEGRTRLSLIEIGRYCGETTTAMTT